MGGRYTLLLITLLVINCSAQTQGVRPNGKQQVGIQGINKTASSNVGDGGIDFPDGGVVYDSDAQEIINQMVNLTEDRKAWINTTVKMFKDSFAVSSITELGFDFIYYYAANDTNNTKVNWIFPTQRCTTVNLLAFETDRGWTRSASGSYINTGFNISIATFYSRNSASLFLYSRTNVDEVSIDMGIRSGTFEARITTRLSSSFYGDVNSALASVSSAVANSLGLYSTVRRASSETELYKNGASLFTNTTDPSIALISANLFTNGGNNGSSALTLGCTRQISFVAAGKDFTDTQERMIFNIVEYSLDQIGAGVVN